MGSRGIVLIGRDQDAIKRSFGIQDNNAGACYTRTGRRFFTNPKLETQFFDRTRRAIANAGLWDQLNTDWLLLDCEILPWSLKAQGLIQNSYGPVGAAGVNTLNRTADLLQQTRQRDLPAEEMTKLSDLTKRTDQRLNAVQAYREAYQAYCGPSDELGQIQVAPFHLLAAQNQLFLDNTHDWHLAQALKLHQQDPDFFRQTDQITADPADPADRQLVIDWWTNLTSKGGEGMVVKPMEYIPNGNNSNVQPALKVRGPEYLRIIYGPEYNLPGNIERMRRRGLQLKRSLALREFHLGVEGLHRFTQNEPLHRVHQCVFAVLALESEPTDPRL